MVNNPNKTENITKETAFELVPYKVREGQPDIQVRFDHNAMTAFLTQAQMADLFHVNTQAITKHINNIYAEGELEQEATCSILEQVRKEGDREVKRSLKIYNLEMIISVAFRVNSKRGTQFRQWANEQLKNIILYHYGKQQMPEQPLPETPSKLTMKLEEMNVSNPQKTLPAPLNGGEMKLLLQIQINSINKEIKITL